MLGMFKNGVVWCIVMLLAKQLEMGYIGDGKVARAERERASHSRAQSLTGGRSDGHSREEAGP